MKQQKQSESILGFGAASKPLDCNHSFYASRSPDHQSSPVSSNHSPSPLFQPIDVATSSSGLSVNKFPIGSYNSLFKPPHFQTHSHPANKLLNGTVINSNVFSPPVQPESAGVGFQHQWAINKQFKEFPSSQSRKYV